MEPQLTIAIPTYNRLVTLKKSLQKVLDYTEGHDEIELFVSDNASTDGTKEYIEDLQKKYNNLNYYRNDRNLGLDGNFLNCFQKAKGKYLWMISDDDYIMENAVELVLKVVVQEPVIVYCNSYLKEGVDDGPLAKGGITFLKDRNSFLKSLGIYITFVSGLVYNMSLVRKIEDLEQYKGENLLLSHIALDIMRENGTYVLIKEHCMYENVSEISYDYYQTYFYGMKRLIWNTAVNSGFDINVLNDILYQMLKWPVMDVVFHQRRSFTAEGKWDKNYVWDILKDYPDLYQMYRLIIGVPKIDLTENYLKVQKMRMNEVIEFCQQYEHIYFYGCGACGEIFYQYLLEAGINIKAVILSDGEAKKEFHGLDVYYLSEISINNRNDAIVVTPFGRTSRGIQNQLETKSYHCYFNKYRTMMNPVIGNWIW